MSHYSGLKMTLSVQRETRSYPQLLYIVGNLRYRRFTVSLVRSLGYCTERIRGDFLNAVSYSCNSDSRTVSLLFLSESLYNNNNYLSISFTAHLGGHQCAEELLSECEARQHEILSERVHCPSCSGCAGHLLFQEGLGRSLARCAAIG